MKSVDILEHLPCTAEQLMGKIDRGYISCYKLLEKAVSLKLAERWGREPTEKGRLIDRYQITELGVITFSGLRKRRDRT